MIKEIIGREHAELLHSMNALEPSFPKLTDKHITEGYWFIAYEAGEPVGFAGMVEFLPFNIGYLKRAYVSPDHRGRGLQGDFLALRALKAQKLGWRGLVAECPVGNIWSAENFRRAGYTRFVPEQKWAGPDDLYFMKRV